MAYFYEMELFFCEIVVFFPPLIATSEPGRFPCCNKDIKSLANFRGATAAELLRAGGEKRGSNIINK